MNRSRIATGTRRFNQQRQKFRIARLRGLVLIPRLSCPIVEQGEANCNVLCDKGMSYGDYCSARVRTGAMQLSEGNIVYVTPDVTR